MNTQSRLTYRLPTEAEWEYAARSGGKREKYSGTSREDELDQYAWYYKNSNGKTHPVGQKRPNGLGLYDMSGNAMEWCADLFDKNYYKNSPRDNPRGPENGQYRLIRGGSASFIAGSVRAALRVWNLPAKSDFLLGFRLSASAR